MATRKNRKSRTSSRVKEMQLKAAVDCAFPSEQERLPLHIPGAYQVAMGARAEIVAWLRGFQNTHAILIPFPNEASYRMYGPIFWHVVCQLPEIVARIRRRRFEQLVDALMQLKLRQDQYPRRPKRRVYEEEKRSQKQGSGPTAGGESHSQIRGNSPGGEG